MPTAETYGAGVGNIIARIGLEGVTTMMENERQKADELAVLKGDNELDEFLNLRLYDPDQGELAKKGEDAFGAPERVADDLRQKASEIRAGLTNDRQRMAFERRLAQRAQAMDLQLRRHVFQQMQEVDVKRTQAFIANRINEAAAVANDGALVAKAQIEGETALLDHLNRQGVRDPEVQKDALMGFRSQLHSGVIDSLMQGPGGDRAAQAYFNDVKDQLDAKTREAVQRQLEEGSFRGEAQRELDRIVSQTSDMSEALRMARELGQKDSKLRDEVESRVVRHFQLKRAAENEAIDETMIWAANILDKNGGNIDAVASTSRWQRLSPEARSSLDRYAESKRPGGKTIKTDLTEYDALWKMIEEKPDDFKTFPLLTKIDVLSESDFKMFRKIQTDLRVGKATTEEIDDHRTRAQVVSEGLALFGIDTGDNKNDARVALINRMVAERERRLQQLTGKKITNEDLQAIVDDVMSSSAVSGDVSSWQWLPGGLGPNEKPTKRIFEFTPSDVPASRRAEVEASLRASGTPVSDETIMQRYLEITLTIKDIPPEEIERLKAALRAKNRSTTDADVVALFLQTRRSIMGGR